MILRHLLLTVTLTLAACASKPAPAPESVHSNGNVLHQTAPDAAGRGTIVIKDPHTGKPIKLNYEINDGKHRKY